MHLQIQIKRDTVLLQLIPAGTILNWGSEGRVVIKGGVYLRAGSILQFFKIVLQLCKKWPIFDVFLLLRVQFKGGYYSTGYTYGAGSIQGRVQFKDGY